MLRFCQTSYTAELRIFSSCAPPPPLNGCIAFAHPDAPSIFSSTDIIGNGTRAKLRVYNALGRANAKDPASFNNEQKTIVSILIWPQSFYATITN